MNTTMASAQTTGRYAHRAFKMADGITPETATHLRRHRFSPDIRAQLRELHKLDNWHGPVAWIEDVCWIAAAIIVTHWIGSMGYFWPAYLLIAFPIISFRQRAAATLLHESAHGTLAKNKRLNRLLGTYLSGYLILQSFSAYFSSHVRDHHGHFNDPLKDPDLHEHIRVGLYEPWTPGQFARRYLLRPLIASQLPLIKRLVSTRLTYRGDDRRELTRFAVFIVATTVVACLLFGITNVILFWYAPLFLGFPVVNWYIELLEHFPYPMTAEQDIEATRHRALGPVTRHFFGIHNEGYHLDHHLTPGIPFWNLKRAHQIRMHDPEYAAAVARSHAGHGGSLRRQLRSIVMARPASLLGGGDLTPARPGHRAPR